MHKNKVFNTFLTDIAKKDLKDYKIAHNFKSIKIFWDLIDDIMKNGEMIGKGNPERLRRELKGYFSRQINEIDRLVYKIVGDTIIIVSCKGHYNK